MAEDERHRHFDQMRCEHPVYWDPPSRSFVLSRLAVARAWLSDGRQWKDADRAAPGSMVRLFKPADANRPGDRDCGIGWMDDPAHARVRRPIQAALYRRAATLRPTVEAIVRDQLSSISGERFDALADYAMPIPVAVIGRVLGIDTADFEHFRAWSEAVLNVFNPDPTQAEQEATTAAVEAIYDHLDAVMAARRRRPGDDLITDLLAEQAATRCALG